MPTVDLSLPQPPPEGLLAGLPRRLTLTLPELRLAAELAGDAPLPFDSATTETSSEVSVDALGATGLGGLESRLGASRGEGDRAAYDAALAGLLDPARSLARRGLVEPDGSGTALEPGLAGAIGLLATPEVALDLDVTVGSSQARAWHRQGRAAVATLSTSDGLAFEIAWFATARWAGELARVAALPEGTAGGTSALPDSLDLPFELLDASGEALRAGRAEAVPVLAAGHAGQVLADGRPAPEAQVPGLLTAVGRETRGRLRALVAHVGEGDLETVGVTSWLLLADGWHALRPHRRSGTARVEIHRVAPDDLAAALSPVIAEVTR